MWPALIAAGIGAAGSIIGSKVNSNVQSDINEKNKDLQKEFAQNSIQWRVQDAQKAGIHPLAALGAAGYQASPSYVGSDSGIAQAGQQISQGIMQQFAEDASEKNQLELKRMQLENLKLEKEINEMGQNPSVHNIFNQNPLSTFNNILDTGNNLQGVDNFKQVYDVNKDMQISAYPGGDYLLSFKEGSTPAEALAEGHGMGVVASHADFIRRLSPAIKDAEKEARKKGLLKQDEEWELDPWNYSPYGYVLKKVKKGDNSWGKNFIKTIDRYFKKNFD